MKTLNNIQKLSKIGNLQNITLSANLLTVYRLILAVQKS